MTRILIVLAALVAAALLVHLALARGASPPAPEVALAPLRASEDVPLAVSTLQLDLPGGERIDYAYSGGLWRCTSALGAPAHIGRMGELVLGLAQALGMPRALSPRELARAGLDEASAVRVTLRSADGTLVLAADVGRHLPGIGGGRSFVRRVADGALLEIDASVRELVERPEGSVLPPLLDQRVLAGTQLDPRLGLRRMFVDRPGEKSLELVPDPDAAPEDFRWHVLVDGVRDERDALPFRTAGWLAFLVRAPYAGFAGLEAASALGLDRPEAVVTLVPVGGEPIVLEIGALGGRPLAPVKNRGSGLVLLLEPEHHALLAPTLAQLVEPEGGNPWERWLRP